MSEMDDRRYCAVWRAKDSSSVAGQCTDERAEMLSEIAELRALQSTTFGRLRASQTERAARPDPMVVAEAVRRTFRAAAEIVERPPSAIWTVQEAADLLRAHAKCGHPASDVVGDMCQRCGLTVPQALASLGTTTKTEGDGA